LKLWSSEIRSLKMWSSEISVLIQMDSQMPDQISQVVATHSQLALTYRETFMERKYFFNENPKQKQNIKIN
jgi:hypothetical protein